MDSNFTLLTPAAQAIVSGDSFHHGLGEPVAQALYNPVSVREGITMKEYAPPEVLAFLHEHWHKYSPLNPLWYYGFALWYMICGKNLFLRLF